MLTLNKENSDAKLKVKILNQISAVGSDDWDACACPEFYEQRRPIDPFTTYRFLNALEESGSVGEGTGWLPMHIVVLKEGKIIAVMPLYVKGHSQGEYIFDHGWANAYLNAGGRYYPKLQSAVPFTPVTGRRFLTKLGFETEGRKALIQSVKNLAKKNNFSSIHITFCTEDEVMEAENCDLSSRESIQFHWTNRGFKTFECFLNSLSSRKRKSIRKERRVANHFGGEILQLTGDMLEPTHWDSFWRFYQDTGSRKWGSPYLTRTFFDILQQDLKNDILLVLALKNNKPIAGALNFIGRETLFGRYWGAIEDHSFLHYELCYYQAIDYAVKNNIKRIEAGAQGDHKLSRGYLPAITHSLHWFLNSGFFEAVNKYLKEEKTIIRQQYDDLIKESPFK
mgnify:FL=1